MIINSEQSLDDVSLLNKRQGYGSLDGRKLKAWEGRRKNDYWEEA